MSRIPLKNTQPLLPRLSKLKQAAYTYNWKPEFDELLPEHYKKRCWEFMTTDPTPVHWKPEPGRWKFNQKLKKVVPVQNVPIRIFYPEEANKGLWGGEGIVKGFHKKNGRFAKRVPKYWFPYLTKRAIYSEILDKWYSITVTMRTLDLIDEAYGFDNYILQTHERDLNSKLAMDIRREILLALSRKTLYPDNPMKRDKMLKKYKEFIISEEEAEWVGLSVKEAIIKARKLQEEANPSVPLKDLLTEELIHRIQDQKLSGHSGVEESGSSFLSKINPFASKEK